MSRVSKESASHVEEMGIAEDRHEDIDGYTVDFVSIREESGIWPRCSRAAGRSLPVPALAATSSRAASRSTTPTTTR